MSIFEGQNDRFTGRVILAAVIICLALIALMPVNMFWDQDEAYYARSAIEMSETGDWIVPRYNGEVFAHKPPFIYWMMALGMKVFGENELGARLISAPMTALAGIFLFLIGRRMFDARTGLWSMLIYPSMLLVAYLGTTAMLDAALIAFTLVAMWAYVERVYTGRRTLALGLVFGVAIGLSMLTKGPAGPAVVIPAVAISWLLMRADERPSFAAMVWFAICAIGGFAMFLAWAIPANNLSGGEMLSSGVGVHIIGRALSPMEGHGGSGLWGYLATLPVYIPVVLIGISPWIMQFPAAAAPFVSSMPAWRRERIILLSWAIPGFVLFSFAATKLPHYIVPIFPPLALMIGLYLTQVRGSERRSLERLGAWIYLVSTLALAAGVLVLGYFHFGGVSWSECAVTAFVIAAFAYAAFREQMRGERLRAARILLASVFPVLALLLLMVIAKAETVIKISRPLAAIVNAQRLDGTKVFAEGYLEPSLVFYLSLPAGEIVNALPQSDEELASALDETGEIYVIARDDRLDAIRTRLKGLNVETVGEASGWNTNANNRFERVVVLKVNRLP